jgi:hypothetical protein
VFLWLLHTDPGDEIFLIILQSISQMIGISKLLSVNLAARIALSPQGAASSETAGFSWSQN